MKPASEIKACVIDKGIFLPTAIKLATQFSRCDYWTPSEEAFPTSAKAIIGSGYPNLIRLDDLWESKEYYDLFIFLDVGFKGLQRELARQGFPVWGSRDGYELETKRGQFLKTIEGIGLDVPQYQTFKGISVLREFLCDPASTDLWIKISRWRGDTETFHFRDWALDGAGIDALSARLGPVRELMVFYVFEPIDTDIEDGVDSHCIDGALPSVCLHAMEAKDRGLLGTMTDFKDIPERVRKITEAFAPILGEHEYRQFFSTEVRIAGDKNYFIDPTLRCGSPPSQLQTELYKNLGEIIWQGANGVCIDPDPTEKFGVQLEITMKRDKGEWALARIPEHLRQWVKCGFSCVIDGLTCIPPNDWMHNEFGWLIAIGDTIEATIDRAKELAADLPDGICCDTTTLAGLIEEVQEAEKAGMEFTSQPVPEPATVIE